MAATDRPRTLPLAAPGLPAKVTTIPANQTLYVGNLPSNKIQKEDLRMALYMLFSTYGPVLDVVALKTMKMRGQAHIVYRDIQTSTQAMRALNGFTFLGNEITITYAKGKSNIISRLDGTLKLPNSAAANVQTTELQQSIFNAPVPGSAAASVPSQAPAAKPQPPEAAAAAKDSEARGQKRGREEEEEEEDSDVAMEEDSDDD